MTRIVVTAVTALAALAIAAPAFAAGTAEPPKKLDVALYVDTVNGARPVNAPRRPIGCTQTNTFTRGEQIVFRIWGSILESGDVLSTENVKYAYVKVPGQPNLALSWGPHGAASNRVWFWAAAWNPPADYPLGQVTFRVVFKTEDGAFGTTDFVANIVPALKTPQR